MTARRKSKTNQLARKLDAAKAAWIRGETRGWQKVAQWVHSPAKSGNAEAQLMLARLYDTGYGVKRDDIEATKWYRLAAENGSPDAQYTMGRMYEWGVVQDLKKAKLWYQKAAKNGHMKAKKRIPELSKKKDKKNPFMVSIYLRGDKLNPDAITARLKTKPSSTHRKGDKRKFKNNEYIRKTGIWHLRTKSRSEILSDHIQELGRKVGEKRLENIPDVEEAEVDVWMGYIRNKSYKGFKHSKYGEYLSFELTKENIDALSRFGLPIHFTLSISDS
jgi:TPR repeat protein